MRAKLTFQGGKGLNRDGMPSELAPGVWSAMANFRSRAGFDELWEGAYLQYSTGAVVPLWGLPYATTTKFAVYCSATKVYSLSGASTVTDLTRYTDGIVISNMTAVGTTVTVTTAAAHGRTTADVIDVWGAVPTTYNVTGKAITVTGGTTFTYVADSAPGTSPATVMGAYSYNVEANFSALSGVQRYSGGSFAGLFLFNHPGAGLYYWNGDTAINVRKVPGFNGTSTWNTAKVVRPFGKYIVVLGQTKDGTNYPHNVRWPSSVSDQNSLPTSWTSADTNDAGETNLSAEDGGVVDCMPLGDSNVIYCAKGRWLMTPTGNTDAFTFTRLPGAVGLLAPNCVASTPMGHVFLTPDLDVMIHMGGEPKSIAAGRVKRYLWETVPPAYAHLCFLAVNPEKHEVLVCYPQTATTVCDKALAWNWVDDTWGGPFDFTSNGTSTSGVSFASNGFWPSALGEFERIDAITYFAYHSTTSANVGLYYTVEATAGRWFEADHSGTLERTGIDGGDRDVMKCIHRSRWVMDATGTTVGTVSHGASSFADTAPTYATGVSYTVGTTDYANARSTQGRFLAIKFVATTVGTTPLRVRSVDVDIATGGSR